MKGQGYGIIKRLGLGPLMLWRVRTVTNRIYRNLKSKIVVLEYTRSISTSTESCKSPQSKRLFSAAIIKQFSAIAKLEQMWTRKFLQADIPDPEESVKWISEHVKRLVEANQKSKQTFADSKLEELFETEFVKLCTRRLKREPVQYVIGDWDFRFLTLLMKPPVFIPRPETEGLVELVNHHLTSSYAGCCCEILEIGCGTGAISLSLASENPMVKCTAIDISEDAVGLAKENAKRLKLSSRVNIYHCDIASFHRALKSEKFDLIVSNPPYIPTKDMQDLQPEISCFEDHRALHGGETGLDVVNEILSMAGDYLQPGGSLWMEVDSTHPPLIQEIVEKDYQGQLNYSKTHNDIYDRPRFCELEHS